MTVSNDNILVWAVKEGPVNSEDMPEEDRPDHPAYVSYLVLSVTQKAEPEFMFEYELWFSSFNEAYNYKKVVDSKMEPISLLEGVV